jgi:hypothetical protein
VTHVLFIDDDMGFGANCLSLMLARREPIVIANYRRKTPPWAFTCRRMEGDKAVEVPTGFGNHGLEEVSFGGFGFCLIEVGILRQLKKPRFLNRWIEHQQIISTEDYPFFQAIHDANLAKVYVDHDVSHYVAHIGDYAYKFDTGPYIPEDEKLPFKVIKDFKFA